MSKMQTANQPALSRRAIRTRLLLTLIYAALVPYLIYRVGTERYHLSAVNALLLAALSPAIGTLIEFVRKRQMSVLGLLALVGIAAKVVSALLFNNARVVLISDSLLTGVYGLLLLGSVLIGKPVTVTLVTNMYATSPEQREQMKQRLQASETHRHVMILTAMWGVGLLLLLAISVLLTYTLPIATVVLVRPAIDYGMIAALIAGTVAYGYVLRVRKRRQIARERQA
jgi:predicted membrane channel-forming protein YqfA (hemolysin III family)